MREKSLNYDIYNKNNTYNQRNSTNSAPMPVIRRETPPREPTYYPSPNQPRYSTSSGQNQQQTSNNNNNSTSKLRFLSENADRMVENLNSRYQPSKSQLGRIKDVSPAPEPKIKLLHTFSSKFIDKANRFQHRR